MTECACYKEGQSAIAVPFDLLGNKKLTRATRTEAGREREGGRERERDRERERERERERNSDKHTQTDKHPRTYAHAYRPIYLE